MCYLRQLKCELLGQGTNGRLGVGSTTNKLVPVTSLLPTGRTARKISAGQQHICAILDNFTVSCWGDNEFGQIGNGDSGGGSDVNTPPDNITMPDNRYAIDIASGEDHTCAILDNSSVSCWGRNHVGQLGIGTTSEKKKTLVSFYFLVEEKLLVLPVVLFTVVVYSTTTEWLVGKQC